MAFIVVLNFARRYGSVLRCRIAVAGFLLLPFPVSGHTATAFDDDGGEHWLAEEGSRPIVRVDDGSFDATVLKGLAALGQPFKIVKPEERGMFVGFWIGVQIDPTTRRLRAAGTLDIPSHAESY